MSGTTNQFEGDCLCGADERSPGERLLRWADRPLSR